MTISFEVSPLPRLESLGNTCGNPCEQIRWQLHTPRNIHIFQPEEQHFCCPTFPFEKADSPLSTWSLVTFESLPFKAAPNQQSHPELVLKFAHPLNRDLWWWEFRIPIIFIPWKFSRTDWLRNFPLFSINYIHLCCLNFTSYFFYKKEWKVKQNKT